MIIKNRFLAFLVKSLETVILIMLLGSNSQILLYLHFKKNLQQKKHQAEFLLVRYTEFNLSFLNIAIGTTKCGRLVVPCFCIRA